MNDLIRHRTVLQHLLPFKGVKATNAGAEIDLASVKKTKACLIEQKLTPGYL